MKSRVRIGTCSGPAEAAFVRSVFDAHDLPVLISGEQHASVLGGLGGFVRLDIFVAEQDAEDAAALLRDIREGDHAISEDDDLSDSAGAAPDGDDRSGDGLGADRDERAEADGLWNAQSVASEPPEVVARQAPGNDVPTAAVFDPRRRRTAAALLLSVPGLGAAHIWTGAWGRGLAIATANGFGIWAFSKGYPAAAPLLVGLRFIDLAGALWRIWRPSR
jgi:hypothetical protein